MDTEIKVSLLQNYKKPTVKIKNPISTINALIDTGAHSVIYFGSELVFRTVFPDATPTNYTTYISGLGGTDKAYSPIWKIKDLTFADKDNGTEFHIRELPVVIYDTEKDYGCNMLIGGTIFNLVDFGFVNRTSEKYMTIKFDDDVTGVCDFVLNSDGSVQMYGGKSLVKSTRTFFQSDVKNALGVSKGHSKIKKMGVEKSQIQGRDIRCETRVVKYKGSYISKRHKGWVFAIEVDGKEVRFTKRGTIRTRDNHIEYVYRDKRYRLVLGSSSNLTPDQIKYLFDGAKTN